jgi:hypothetical protein
MLQLYVTVFFYKVSFLKKEIDTDQKYNRGKIQWTIQSFILQSSHIMILNSTKFGGNRTKDVEVGPDRQTDRPIPIYLPPPPNYVCGGYNKNKMSFMR